VTLVAHATMLSGVAPDVHGISWDDYRPDKGCITVPTVFGLIHEMGQRTVLVAGKQKFQHLNVPGTIDSIILTPRGDADVANEAVVQVQAGFDFLFVHFPDTDLAGHTSGWLSSTYLARIGDADRAIGRLLQALPAQTTVILTADHGGHASNHGTAMTEDMVIPWIIAGPRVPGRGREIQATVRTADTAVTALYVLGFPAPAGATGQVVAEAFAQ
jgi:predicted AlkP superfamily pyrophosphatase or phosphodiesterase